MEEQNWDKQMGLKNLYLFLKGKWVQEGFFENTHAKILKNLRNNSMTLRGTLSIPCRLTQILEIHESAEFFFILEGAQFFSVTLARRMLLNEILVPSSNYMYHWAFGLRGYTTSVELTHSLNRLN